ncbi:hypothetical protein ACLB2K_048616 [Fragaria x ananassa]
MGDSLAELERIQTQILDRISDLEISFASLLPQTATQNGGGTEVHLSAILKSKGVNDFSFKRVASDYYDWPLESRRDAVGAASVQHLCKSIVLVNTQAIPSVVDCSDRNNSKYYVVVVQVILDEAIQKLNPDFFWLGGGEVDLKLGIKTSQFINVVKPFIVSCSSST